MIFDLKMSEYIFLTTEGITFQPGSKCIQTDIENLQVIGFSNGKTSKEAFKKMICENPHLLETNFNEIFSLELVDFSKRNYYFLKEGVD